MNLKITNPKMLLYLTSAVTLLSGFCSAISVYVSAANPSDSGLAMEPENSRMYVHDLELYGGKVNLLADELKRLFAGLWHGESLAYTIGFITMLVCCGLFFVAYHMSYDSDSDKRDKPIEV